MHCCFRRAHTQCLNTSAPGYSRTDMVSTCGKCLGLMTTGVVERIEEYANMCAQTETEGPYDAADWVVRWEGTDMDLNTLVPG